MTKLFLMILTGMITLSLSGQINAGLLRYLDISDEQICFVYGEDIWLMPLEGGTATPLTNSEGEVSWPRFSPDGKHIAFTADYNGNDDIYILPVTGGIPKRITYNSFSDRMVDWHPSGEKIIFASGRESGRQSFRQFYEVGRDGGLPEKLEIPYGEIGSFSPDGKQFAYITRITENYPFKRYRGGLTSDIIIYHFGKNSFERVTENPAIDGKPSWYGNTLYFVSDRDENMRLNVWACDPVTKKKEQLTRFTDFDISFMAAGEGGVVFEKGGKLHLMDHGTRQVKTLEVKVADDLTNEMPGLENVSKSISGASLFPGDKRVIFEARGDLFNVPAENGYTLNLTRSSGANDRDPAISPDGKFLAWWSDLSGEYEIYLLRLDEDGKPEQMTSRGKGYGYSLFWSPDSKKMAFIDETNTLFILETESKELTKVDHAYFNIGHGGRSGFPLSWSPDSKWLAYAKGKENANSAIFLYQLEEKKIFPVTSGFYSDHYPVFSNDGKYLFYLTHRNFSPSYSALDDGTWVYPNATQIAAISLSEETPSLLAPRNDSVEKKKEEGAEEDDKDNKKKEKDTEEESKELKINTANMESRILLLPPPAGNIRGLMPFEGKLVFYRSANTGAEERTSKLEYYDLEERETKTIISDVDQVVQSPDQKSILVGQKGKYGILKPAESQKIEKPVPADDLTLNRIPREEWRQVFNDTWRRYRDFFYDPAMHGVDWDEMKQRYGALVEEARSRSDITFIQSNMQAELSAGHTYTGTPSSGNRNSISTGFLGIDWEEDQGMFKIKRIVKPAEWDTEVRSPFDNPGTGVKEGYYIHSVNGIPLEAGKDPYAPFEGLSGKTVSLKVSENGKPDDAEEKVIKCLSPLEEVNLRYLEWIENNRKLTGKLSDGKLGYVYMSNTSGQGQRELVKMYYGQLDKQGFIIDERFNGGGQLADRFMELLLRPVVYNLHWRHGADHTQPMKANMGPKAMLINGWAGSGGDGLPWAFQELEAGPIIGERTLGILVGPATGHMLMDGGYITVPGARLYDNDGHWFWEGEGVKPDIPVWDDPNILKEGRDPQIEKAVEELLKILEENPPGMTPAPEPEIRTAKGLLNLGE